ncbi:MAG: acetylglutamate kinase [Candidatus Altiarchaeales archaeon IMC4]|nr:MAG: acetylglutamate kinase [Candidatus Altiarchaeales archaeon IMC4]
MKTADVLIDALEYIKRFAGQTFVVKLGGEVMMSEEVMDAVAQDLILLNYVNIKPVVIHGGGVEITRAMDKFGKKPQFIDGLRVTDKETMDIVKMVLVGQINTGIVSRINKHGGNAVGLSGKSGKLFVAKKKAGKVDIGFVGEIEKVNPDIVNLLIEKNYIPVVSPIGLGADGEAYNINADVAAGALAAELGASKLILLTDVKGVLRKDGTLIKRLVADDIEELIKDGTAKSGMIPKLKAIKQALDGGVKRAHIIKAKKHAILEEVFTSTGAGTMITKEEVRGE